MPYGFVSHVFIEILPLVNPRVSFLLISTFLAGSGYEYSTNGDLPWISNGFPMDFQRISNGFPGSPWMWQGNAGPRSIGRLGDRNEIRASGVQVRCPAEGDFDALHQLVPSGNLT
jgi:hypothetical protein